MIISNDSMAYGAYYMNVVKEARECCKLGERDIIVHSNIEKKILRLLGSASPSLHWRRIFFSLVCHARRLPHFLRDRITTALLGWPRFDIG